MRNVKGKEFMADITIPCEACHGKRFKRDILDIRYREKNIYDILEMTVNEAIGFFSEVSGTVEQRIVKRLRPLQEVGLGYIKLGQSSSTLSGGENQRVKLAHFHDINTLMKAFDRLIAQGHTVLVIEHNMDVIKSADHVIDIGPEGGDAGGKIVAEGTPEEIAKCPASHTGHFIKEKL